MTFNAWFTATPALAEADGDRLRSTIGGSPIVSEQQDWPVCSICNARQLFCFQFDIRSEFNTRFESDSHLLLFACPEDIQGGDPTDKENPGDSYTFILNKAGVLERRLEQESRLVPIKLDWSVNGEAEPGSWPGGGLSVSAIAQEKATEWLQKPACSCGAEMIFLAYLNKYFHFPFKRGTDVEENENIDWIPKSEMIAFGYPVDSVNQFASQKISVLWPNSPVAKQDPDNDWFLATKLFYGNVLLIFACGDQCSPHSVRIVQSN